MPQFSNPAFYRTTEIFMSTRDHYSRV